MRAVRIVGEKTRRPLWSYMLRVMGVLVGLMVICSGSLAVIEDGPFQPRHILVLLNFVGMGVLFCWYGVTGQARLRVPVRPASVWLLWGLGLLGVAVGAYTLMLDDTVSAPGKVVIAICAVGGAWMIVLGVVVRKRLLVSRSAQ